MELADAVAATIAAIPPEAEEAAVAYVDDTPLLVGDTLYLDRRPHPVEQPTYLAFVDCESGQNWGHRCVCVRCGVDDDTVVITETSLPPTVESGRRHFRAVAVGERVPDWSVLPRP